MRHLTALILIAGFASGCADLIPDRKEVGDALVLFSAAAAGAANYSAAGTTIYTPMPITQPFQCRSFGNGYAVQTICQ